jgi:hypothetical protein
LASVDTVAGHGHRLVEGCHLERDVVGHDLETLTALGILDEQIVGQRTGRSAVADDPAGGGHRIDHDVIAHRDAGDVAAHLDDLAGGFMTQWHMAVSARHSAQRDVKGVRTADSARPNLDQYIRRSAVGVGRSSTCVSPGEATTNTFICMLLHAENLVVPGDQGSDVARDDVG